MNEDSRYKHAIKALENGEVIITPSESCYGLSCDATNPEAVKKLHELKKEPLNKPLTLLVTSLDQIKKIAEINKTAETLSAYFHPGQLNIIVPLRDPDKYSFLSPNGTIAFRISALNHLHSLVTDYGKAITTTSANIHGEPPIYKEAEIRNHPIFGNVYSILMPDTNEQPLPSTIYSSIDNSIIRQGPVTLAHINHVLAQNAVS